MVLPNVSIRIGARHDDVIVDGVVFDRSKMNRSEKHKLRRILTGVYREYSEKKEAKNVTNRISPNRSCKSKRRA